MNALLGISLGLVNFLAVSVPQTLDSSEEPCDYILKGYDLGASCDYDDDCVADHSYCRNQQVCQCRIGYTPAPDGISCLAMVGARCQTNFDCMSLDHSDCQQDVCQCKPDFVPDPTRAQCLPRVLTLQGTCLLDSQCQASFGDFSHCWGSRCDCMVRYHFRNGRCYFTRDIGEDCNNSTECYVGSEYTNVVECLNRKCQCIPGYYVDRFGKCVKSAGYVILPTATVLLFFTLFSTTNYYL